MLRVLIETMKCMGSFYTVEHVPKAKVTGNVKVKIEGRNESKRAWPGIEPGTSSKLGK